MRRNSWNPVEHRPYPTMSASPKNWAISMVAFSGLSEPCTELPVKLSANS